METNEKPYAGDTLYNLDRFVDRSGTNSVKWEFMRKLDPQADEETLPFWVADMDFQCAEPILNAIRERVGRQIFGYSNHHTGEYFRAVCGWYEHRFGWYVNSADLVYSPGVVPAIGFLIEILTQPGDGVIIQRPVYYPFFNMIRNHGRVVVNNPLLQSAGHYEMDFDDLEKKAGESGAKLLIFCSPHNPSGRVWQEDELRRLGQICATHGITIISDEIHYDLVRRGVRHIPLAKVLPEYKKKIITATAPSKTFNLAGLQLSNIIIPDPEIREKWNSFVVNQFSIKSPNCLSIAATQAAYLEGEDWLEQVLGYLDANLNFITDFIGENLPKVKYQIPEGTYLAWLDCSAYGYAQEELVRKMLREAKVLIEDGVMFGPEGDGYIRINAACTRDVLRAGLTRMAAVINKS